MMFKLIDWFVLNESWTSLGKYMQPKIQFLPNQRFKSYVGGKCSYGIFNCSIKIRKKYINDIGIQKHELCHARQFGRLFWLHSTMSMLSGKYRLLIELEAYRSQVKEYNYRNESDYLCIVDALDTKYNTKVNRSEISKYARYAFLDLIKQETN